MSGDGGDSGGDGGGSGKGGGGGGSNDNPGGADQYGFNATSNSATADPNSFGAGPAGGTSSYAPDPSTNGGGSLDQFISDPSGGNLSGGSLDQFSSDPSGGNLGSGSLDQFISDPSGGNLSGPGPVGNEAGQPGAGGGTNQPFSGNDFSFNSPLAGIDANSFTGNPVAGGGVFETGTSPVQSSAGFDNLVSASNNPGGTSAAGTAAPAGVSGNTDISSNSNLSTAKPTNTASTGGSSNNSGILSSLGLGGGNTAGALVGAAGLLNNLVTGNKAPAGSAPLTANAATTNATAAQQTSAGQSLQQWQTTGTLPDSYESQVQRAAQDAKTRAISNAAAQGLPTDPTLNTALAQQFNAIDAALPGQREAIAERLAQSGTQMVQAGLQATGISSGVYQNLATMDQSQQNARGAAIANFASALNGGGNRGLTLKVA